MNILPTRIRFFIFIILTFIILCKDNNMYENNTNKTEEEELINEKMYVTCGSIIRIRNYLTGI